MLNCKVGAKGGDSIEKNISAEKAAKKERAWLSQKNENPQRTQSSCCQTLKGQGKINPLVCRPQCFCGLFFAFCKL